VVLGNVHQKNRVLVVEELGSVAFRIEEAKHDLEHHPSNDEDVGPQSGLARNLRRIEIRIAVFSRVGWNLDLVAPEAGVAFVTRRSPWHHIENFADRRFAPAASVDSRDIFSQRVVVDGGLAGERIRGRNDEIGLSREAFKLPADGLDLGSWVQVFDMPLEGQSLGLPDIGPGEKVPADVLKSENIRVNECKPPDARPCGHIGERAPTTAAANDGEVLLGEPLGFLRIACKHWVDHLVEPP